MILKEMRQTRICGEQDFKREGERDDHMLHYKQVFGNVFERRVFVQYLKNIIAKLKVNK